MGFKTNTPFMTPPGAHLTFMPTRIGYVGSQPLNLRASRSVTSAPCASQAGMEATAAADVMPAAAPNILPGLLTPKWEKELHKALILSPSVPELIRVGNEFEEAKPLAALFVALWEAIPVRDLKWAIESLSWLFETGYSPEEDGFVQKYLPCRGFDVSVAYDAEVQMPLNRDYIGLLLAELQQGTGNLAKATEVLEQLVPSTVTAVALAALYLDQERWADVIELTGNLPSEDQGATYLQMQRGIAYRGQGFLDKAHEAFNEALLNEALSARNRPPELLQRVLIERAFTYLKAGERAMARKYFEEVQTQNCGYPGLQEYLELYLV